MAPPNDEYHVTDTDEYDIVLEPTEHMTVEQLQGLRDLLAYYSAWVKGQAPGNLVRVRQRYCDGRPHVLFYRIGHPPVHHVCRELKRLGIPYQGY